MFFLCFQAQHHQQQQNSGSSSTSSSPFLDMDDQEDQTLPIIKPTNATTCTSNKIENELKSSAPKEATFNTTHNSSGFGSPKSPFNSSYTANSDSYACDNAAGAASNSSSSSSSSSTSSSPFSDTASPVPDSSPSTAQSTSSRINVNAPVFTSKTATTAQRAQASNVSIIDMMSQLAVEINISSGNGSSNDQQQQLKEMKKNLSYNCLNDTGRMRFLDFF